MGIHFPSVSFFRNLGRQSKQFAVIGLGRFGRAVCATLHKQGYEVLGVDNDAQRVAEMLSERLASHTIQLDSTEPIALKEAGIFEFDTVIVGIGNYLQESIITTLNLKEGGVKYIVAKASSDIHGRVLEKVGADLVVYPEHEMGCYLARTLAKPHILERLELDPDSSIVEVPILEEFQGKTLMDLDLRRRYGVSVLAFSENGKFVINPDPGQPLPKGSVLVMIGSNHDINRLVP